MKGEEIINNWKDQRSQIEIGENFTQEVMNHIYQYEQKKKVSLFDMERFVEFISAHPLAKTGLVVAGGVAGIGRVIFMIVMILNKGIING